MNYLLIVFGKSEKQDDFVKTLCSDVSVMSDLGDVRYYYGPESVIITFKCSEDLDSVSSFMELLYGRMNLVYILLPYDNDKLSLKMDNDISMHLFDKELPEENTEKKSDLSVLVQKWMSDELNSQEFISSLERLEESEEDDIDEFNRLKKTKKEPNLDELLDKINLKGISSLTEKELSLLNKYSKL